MKKEALNATIVLFGGTGDLTKRKLVPALANLVHRGRITKRSTIIGVADKDMTDEQYKKFLCSGVQGKKEKAHIKKLNVRYVQGDFSNPDFIKNLLGLLRVCEIKGCNRVYYLATSFRFFPNIIKALKRYGLHRQKSGFTRVLFEKPFGNSLKSSVSLDREIHKVFSEGDVYRLDHYLAKETVQNINILKFTNPLFYSTLSREFVESIEIVVDEKIGVGNRIQYYNEAGAVKDMFQSHLLEVLALLLMEKPKKLNAEGIDLEKMRVLKKIQVLHPNHHLLGQYSSYKKELASAKLKDKKTETFAKISLNCGTKRWNGVKIKLRTGKKLRNKVGKILINFRNENKELMQSLGEAKENKLIINFYPFQSIDIFMNTRCQGEDGCIKSANFDFTPERKFSPNTPSEYSTLLEDALNGEKILFVREDVVRESWKITEKILRMKNKIKFIKYKDCTEPD